MKKNILKLSIFLIIILSLTLASIVNGLQIKTNSTNTLKSTYQENEKSNDDGWYYLPSYQNYAPKGLPDFDQRGQKDWKSRFIIWSFCAPTSVSNIFWWFDSKHSDPNGYPGDGVDSYPLVRDLQSPGDAIPGPLSDDHNYNNVNSEITPAPKEKDSGELIDQVAWYVNQNNRQRKLRLNLWGGTQQKDLKSGVEQWIENAGLSDDYKVEEIKRPSFSYISEKLSENAGIVLLLRFIKPGVFPKLFPCFCGHYVSLAGVNQRDEYVAISDPYLNVMNPDPSPTDHNDASVVSHDIYKVESTPVGQWSASWQLPGYWFSGAFVTYALIITEVNY